jgi:protein-L-isoaspartate(D-aspartate) O-methyltransferase
MFAFLLLPFLTMTIFQSATPDANEQARFNMIEQQIRPWDVLDNTVLDLLHRVKREQFVPTALSGLAFSDTELPLGHGQTMLAPKLEAKLLQACHVRASDRVLEIGTGSAYMAALIGFTAAQVISVEKVAELAIAAQTNLHRALLDNVTVMQGDGFKVGLTQAGERGWDLIVLSGSVTSSTAIPSALLDTLNIGGRLIGVFGNEKVCPMMQAQRVRRSSAVQFDTETLFEANAPALSGLASPIFVF